MIWGDANVGMILHLLNIHYLNSYNLYTIIFKHYR